MKHYVFIGYEDLNGNEHDIQGEDYVLLLNHCFEYASYFSLDFFDNLPSYSKFPLDKINNLPVLRSEKCKFTDCMIRKYYKCSEEAYLILTQDFGNIFGYLWENHGGPENLTFYRNDNSVILEVNTHEAYCELYCLPNDDVAKILQNDGWFDYQKRKYL